MPHKQAIIHAINGAFPTVLTSGIIMTSAAMLIGNISTNAVIAVLGTCIGRGTIITIILVLFVLPSTLVLGDSIIERTRFRVKMPHLPAKAAVGTVRIKGHVRGYIQGVVDGNFDGVLRGSVDANVSTETIMEQLDEADSQQKGGDDRG